MCIVFGIARILFRELVSYKYFANTSYFRNSFTLVFFSVFDDRSVCGEFVVCPEKRRSE